MMNIRAELASEHAQIAKIWLSDRETAVEGNFFHWEWDLGRIAADLKVIWEASTNGRSTMASENVDKMLNVLMDNAVLVAELHLVFAKIEEAADVDATKEEKVEFLRELAGSATTEPSITFAW